jgi:hypothetical protein
MDIELLLNLNIVDTSRTKDTQTDQYSDFSIFLKKDERKYITNCEWSAVDRGFELRSGQTKDYTIDICCFCAKHTALRRKT